MADRITPEQRSRNMQHVHGKNTKPEVYIRRLLFSEGYRYRIHSSRVPGHPDIWMKKYNTAIFVHGCFWHRHKGCKYASEPATNSEFWSTKFIRNITRDMEVKNLLLEKRIKCLVIWECTIKEMHRSQEKEKSVIMEIERFLNASEVFEEL